MEILSHLGWSAKLSLLVGICPLAVAVVYALRPTERALAFARPVSLAAIFAGISGLTGGVAMGLKRLATVPDAIDSPGFYMGLAESLVPAFVNFGFLAVAWLLVAAGMLRRRP
ncbi:MAG TPA: hypothetical protein VD833_00890 [Vicinamibacterales bacterium]|nr:hypothetical protein [Vicinamibacterales bacterium]